MSIEKRQDPAPERRHHGRDEDDFFELDARSMSPRAQVVTSLAVLIPVLVGATLVLTLLPGLWWLIFVFGWMVFPAFGLMVRGVAGLSEGSGSKPLTGNGGKRELLGALREQGELTSAQAAMETSLSVAEADAMLKGLASGGHLDVRVRGGGLFYALWEHERGASRTGLEKFWRAPVMVLFRVQRRGSVDEREHRTGM